MTEIVTSYDTRGVEKQNPWLRWFGENRNTFFGVASPLAVLLLWQVSADLGWLDRRVFSTPIDVVRLSVTMFAEKELAVDVLVTLRRLVVGMLVGALPGAVIGLWMGLSPTARAIINPLVAATYPLPRIALFPLVLFVVGLNENSLVIMVALGPFFTMLISTMTAVMEVPKIYLKVAKSFEAPRMMTMTRVVMPAALPVIISGVQISMGLSLLGVVSAEFLVGRSGLGYIIWHSWTILSLPQAMVGLVLSGVIGFIAYMLVAAFESMVMPYRNSGGASRSKSSSR